MGTGFCWIFPALLLLRFPALFRYSSIMPVWLQVTASFLLVGAVIYYMFRLPRRGEALYGWAPPLALLSVWSGLVAAVLSPLLWVVRYPDLWVAALLLLLEPAALAAGTLVLWIYRGLNTAERTILIQRLQAKFGIGLGLAAVAVAYVYVFFHKTPFTPVGL